jgi:hypothetical protein
MGSGPEGETVDCKVSLIEVAQNVNFYGIEELALIMEEF